jgi:hypothetical protein
MPKVDPNNFSFSGHETFSFRFAWLKKGFDAINKDSYIFSKDKAVPVLGVGKNMVRSIKYWGYATGIFQDSDEGESRLQSVEPTELGHKIFSESGLDPYLENPNTLWLLHWNLVSKPDSFTFWYWIFNEWNRHNFSEKVVVTEISEWAKKQGYNRGMSANTLKRDLNCLIRTYIPARRSRNALLEDTLDCPLIDLELMSEIDSINHVYQLRIGPKPTLSKEFFVYAMLKFWEEFDPEVSGLAIEKISYEKGSPGKAFKLDPDSVVKYLESIEDTSAGELSYRSNAGIQQVYKNVDYIRPEKYLERCYNSADRDTELEKENSALESSHV